MLSLQCSWWRCKWWTWRTWSWPCRTWRSRSCTRARRRRRHLRPQPGREIKFQPVNQCMKASILFDADRKPTPSFNYPRMLYLLQLCMLDYANSDRFYICNLINEVILARHIGNKLFFNQKNLIPPFVQKVPLLKALKNTFDFATAK